MTQTISIKLAVIERINKKINMFERFLLLIIFMLAMSTVYAQQNSPSPTTEADAEVKYAKNIKKSRINGVYIPCLLYTSPSPRDRQKSRMPSSA